MNEDEIKSEIFTLDRFEEGKAVLIGEHFEVVVPKKLIPKKLNPSDIVHLTFSSDEAETRRREQSAKDILNELLKS